MKIRMLGSGREVGRSAIYVKAANERLLLDYGVKISNDPTEYPIEPGAVDGVLLSHAHLDHCGLLPYLYRSGYQGSVYATSTSFDLAKILIEDSIKLFRVKKQVPKYGNNDYGKMQSKEMPVELGEEFGIKKANVRVYDAGHIPGSSSFYIEDGKSLLYSGDVMTRDMRLVSGARPKYPKVDCLIIESTYGDREHKPRDSEEKSFAERIKEILDNRGTVLLPTFAIGRAQEVLLILDRWLKWKYPIYMDGMAVRASEAILRHPDYVKDFGLLDKAFSMTRAIRDHKARKRVMEQPSIVITTSGQLEGGPIVEYMKHFYNRDDCSVFLTGFQIPGNAGRTLLDTGFYKADNLELPVKCAVEAFDFSSHAGRSDLIDYIKKVNPEKVIVNHGDKCQLFANDLGLLGFKAFAPDNGDVVEV